MNGLTVRGRKLVIELGRAIDRGDTRSVLDLVDSYGLPRDQALEVCRALERAGIAQVVAFRYDTFDRAHPVTVSDVWRWREEVTPQSLKA